MARCGQYEFCEDCSNQEIEDICIDCDDGDLFEPLAEDSSARQTIFMALAA